MSNNMFDTVYDTVFGVMFDVVSETFFGVVGTCTAINILIYAGKGV